MARIICSHGLTACLATAVGGLVVDGTHGLAFLYCSTYNSFDLALLSARYDSVRRMVLIKNHGHLEFFLPVLLSFRLLSCLLCLSKPTPVWRMLSK